MDPMNWIDLIDSFRMISSKYVPLLDKCYKLEKQLDQVDVWGIDYLTPPELRRMCTLSQRVLYSYLGLVGDEDNEDFKKDLRKDYQLMFFGMEEGKKGFLERYMVGEKEEKKKRLLRTFLIQLQTFLHHRVYDVFKRVLLSLRNTADEKFQEIAKTKALPPIEREEEML